MATDISASADVIDVRDIIERFEELETELSDAHESESDSPEGTLDEYIREAAQDDAHILQEAATEFLTLQSLLEDLAGCGGDERWRGDWYPLTLIHDMYFEDYARQLADDIGDVKPSNWPYTCIDWARAARELQTDYSTVDYDGSAFWYR